MLTAHVHLVGTSRVLVHDKVIEAAFLGFKGVLLICLSFLKSCWIRGDFCGGRLGGRRILKRHPMKVVAFGCDNTIFRTTKLFAKMLASARRKALAPAGYAQSQE